MLTEVDLLFSPQCQCGSLESINGNREHSGLSVFFYLTAAEPFEHLLLLPVGSS